MTNMLISSSASDISKFTKAKQCVESTKRRKIDRWSWKRRCIHGPIFGISKSMTTATPFPRSISFCQKPFIKFTNSHGTFVSFLLPNQHRNKSSSYKNRKLWGFVTMCGFVKTPVLILIYKLLLSSKAGSVFPSAHGTQPWWRSSGPGPVPRKLGDSWRVNTSHIVGICRDLRVGIWWDNFHFSCVSTANLILNYTDQQPEGPLLHVNGWWSTTLNSLNHQNLKRTPTIVKWTIVQPCPTRWI